MSVVHPLLSRRPARVTPSYALLPQASELQLAQGRVHEACGAARRTLALWLAAQTNGPVVWVVAEWEKDHLHSDGVSRWIDPARLLFVSPKRAEDILWTTEEVLRSGALALVVADLPDLPNLTQVRRMHLAAENGAQMGQHVPVGLLCTPGTGGAPGVETRWQLDARHQAGQDIWRLERLRARTSPRKGWVINQPHGAPPTIKTA